MKRQGIWRKRDVPSSVCWSGVYVKEQRGVRNKVLQKQDQKASSVSSSLFGFFLCELGMIGVARKCVYRSKRLPLPSRIRQSR